MSWKRILGLSLIVVGIILFFVSGYITDEVAEGRQKIKKGQRQVDQIQDASAVNPYTQKAGDLFASSGQKKIDAGKKEADHYESVAQHAFVGAIVFTIAGGILLTISFLPKRR